MAVDQFIPEVWSSEILTSLKKSLVYGQRGVINMDYEGEIAEAGDTVHVQSIARPTISTFTSNTDIAAPEELTDADRVLVIDQAKYFNFQVDDVNARQRKGDVMPTAMTEAAYGLADLVDQFVAAKYTDVPSANDVGTVAITSAAAAYNGLVDLGVKLDEANVPTQGRWAIVPPWYAGWFQKDTNLINADHSADGGQLLRNGAISYDLAGFTVMKSNNAPLITGDDYAVLAGTASAITFAQQILKTEAYRMERRFADGVKGLNVYGAKTVRPECLALLRASKT